MDPGVRVKILVDCLGIPMKSWMLCLKFNNLSRIFIYVSEQVLFPCLRIIPDIFLATKVLIVDWSSKSVVVSPSITPKIDDFEPFRDEKSLVGKPSFSYAC